LKPFLEILGYMPEKINNIGFIPFEVNSEDVLSDPYIEEVLRNI
jgi:hypothetical protein